MNDVIMRSLMFVPGHNERLMLSASRSKADVLILDIEDSVVPESNKEIARKTIVKCLSDGLFDSHLIYPRVNHAKSGHLLKDLSALAIDNVDGFVYPMARGPEDIILFDHLLSLYELDRGFTSHSFNIIPLIETAGAILQVREICKASKRIVGVAFGCVDFINDIQGILDKEGQSILIPRSLIAMAARDCGVLPIDTIHTRVHDMEDLKDNLILARKLGFEGMLVLNPKEIPLVHEFFTPSITEYDNAKSMIEDYNESNEYNKGVFVKNDRFIGPPLIESALKTIKRFEKIRDGNQK